MFKHVRRRIARAIRNYSSDGSSDNHYETLGIPRSASQADIKKAYFEKSKQYHPDTSKDTDENIKKFREVTSAYEVLGNVQTRRMYDRGMSIADTVDYNEDEVVDDPIERYERARKQREMGMSFDSWTKGEYARMREKKAEFKRSEDLWKEHQAEEEMNAKANSTLLVGFGMATAGFLYWQEFVKPQQRVAQNKIENKLNKSPAEKKS